MSVCGSLHCKENPNYVFPEKELRGLSVDFHIPCSYILASPLPPHPTPSLSLGSVTIFDKINLFHAFAAVKIYDY
jgi:hypothetical protein